MNKASISDITRKTAFLLTLAMANWNSEVSACSADVRFGQDFNIATLKFLPSFLTKTVDPSRPETFYAPVTIPALGPSLATDLSDIRVKEYFPSTNTFRAVLLGSLV